MTCSPTTPATPRRSPASPFIPHTDQVRGFVFDVATGKLNEVV
jgi:carbonic anhydrase